VIAAYCFEPAVCFGGVGFILALVCYVILPDLLLINNNMDISMNSTTAVALFGDRPVVHTFKLSRDPFVTGVLKGATVIRAKTGKDYIKVAVEAKKTPDWVKEVEQEAKNFPIKYSIAKTADWSEGDEVIITPMLHMYVEVRDQNGTPLCLLVDSERCGKLEKGPRQQYELLCDGYDDKIVEQSSGDGVKWLSKFQNAQVTVFCWKPTYTPGNDYIGLTTTRIKIHVDAKKKENSDKEMKD
jgi:hypothetical protein